MIKVTDGAISSFGTKFVSTKLGRFAKPGLRSAIVSLGVARDW